MPRLGTARIPIIFSPPKVDVFLFAGQSNMVAYTGDTAPAELLTPNPKVRIWNITTQRWETYVAITNSETTPDEGGNNARFGPEGEFARLWSAANPGKICYIIKYAVGGTGLNDRWMPGLNDLYEATERQIKEAIGQLGGRSKVRVHGIFWEQGGTDAEDTSDASAYQANLTAFISSVRQRWGEPTSKFIFGKVRADYGTFASTVQAAQQAVYNALASTGVVIYYNDDRTLVDDAHWNIAGITNMGQDMYQCFIGTYSAVPGTFGTGDWSVTPGNTLISVGVTALPTNHGALITDIEYRVNSGSWVSSGGTSGFNITGLTNGVSYNVELRAISAGGTGAASASKSATPAAGGGADVDISYTAGIYNGAPSDPQTFSAVAIGTAATGREIYLGLIQGADNSVTTYPTVTIGGVSATRVAEVFSQSDGASRLQMAIYKATVPTGTTADIVVTGIQYYTIGFVWRVMNAASSLFASQSASVVPSGGSPVSANVNTSTGGAVLGIFGSFSHGTLTHTWSGLTEDAEGDHAGFIEHSGASAEISSGETPRSISCTPGAVSGGADGAGILVVSLQKAA